MRPRRNRPLFIIDIAMPRDVEAAAGEIEQVFLYNIDDLQATVRENLARRASEVARAETIVTEEVEKFGGWLQSRGAIPTVVALRAAVRGDPARGARAARLQAVVAAAGGARARRRDHAPDRREAAADADRAAEGARRLRDGRRVHRGADALFALADQHADDRAEPRAAGEGRAVQAPDRRTPVIVATPCMDTAQELRLGTRGSQLALWQANTVAARIAAAGGPPCRIVVIKTSGDRLQDAPLSEIGGKRLFVKEIEDALLGGEIDLAVHSSKDMPAVLPDGPDDRRRAAARGSARRGRAAAVPGLERRRSADRRSRRSSPRSGQSPSIGTGSVRRIAQLTRLFPGARFAADPRQPRHAAAQARRRRARRAGAGGRRTDAARVRVAHLAGDLPAEACVPAPGQGIVAIEIRGDDDAGRATRWRGSTTRRRGDALTAERALVATLGGGCQTPIGALASLVDGDRARARRGRRLARRQPRRPRPRRAAPRRDAAALGARVGAQLLARRRRRHPRRSAAGSDARTLEL